MSTTDTLDFAITPSAITQVSHILSTEPKGAFFRIAIKGGGCSGFSYEFNVDHEIQ
ncbi:MAG: Fe-S cluster assembly iron-binding protein IscA, partial [Alphaproteobacteria bacterium]